MPYPGSLVIVLDILEALPGVVDDVDVSRATRLHLHENMIHFSYHLYNELNQLIISRQNIFYSHEMIALLRLLRVWGLASGITLSHLAEKYNSLFVFMLTCLRSSSNAQCLCEAALSVQSLVKVSEYPRPTHRSSAISMILQAFAGVSSDDSHTLTHSPAIGAFDNSSLLYLLQNTGKILDMVLLTTLLLIL